MWVLSSERQPVVGDAGVEQVARKKTTEDQQTPGRGRRQGKATEGDAARSLWDARVPGEMAVTSPAVEPGGRSRSQRCPSITLEGGESEGSRCRPACRRKKTRR